MTEDTTPERPRPQYGEYATPEEQRARIKDPSAAWVYAPGSDAASASAPAPAPAAAPVAPSAEAGAPVLRPRPVDRIVTIALLAYGAVNVALSAVSFFDLPSVAQQAMQIMGIPGEFTNVEQARTWGVITALVLIVGYLATAALSVLSLRRGRRSWWIPLVGAVATYIVVYVCLAVPLLGDPAFSQYVVQRV